MRKNIYLLTSFIFLLFLIFNFSFSVKAQQEEPNVILEESSQVYSYLYGGTTYTSNISIDDAFKNAMIDQYQQGLVTLENIEIDYGLYYGNRLNYIDAASDNDNSRNPEVDGIKIKLEWQPKENGKYVPLKYMRAELLYIYYNTDSAITSLLLDEGYTDENGVCVFNNTSNWKELLHPISEIVDMINGVELCVRVYPESKTFKVQNDLFSVLNFAGNALADWDIIDGKLERLFTYNYISEKINVGYFNRNGDFGTIQIPHGKSLNKAEPLDECNVLNRSFYVAQSLAMGQKFIEEQGIIINNKVHIAYPAFYGTEMDENAFCYFDYDKQSGLMCIGGRNDGLETIIHEYGHFIHGCLNLFPFSWIDYVLYYGIGSWTDLDIGVNPEHYGDEDHISDPIHGKGKEKGTKFAWSEAWAYSFSHIVQDYYWYGYYVTDESISDTGIDGVRGLKTSFEYSEEYRCEGQEETINVFLNRVYDHFDNGLEMFLSSINYGIVSENKIQTLSTYVQSLMINYPEYMEEISSILVDCQLSSDFNFVSNYSTYDSPILFWYPNGSQYTPLNQFEIVFYNEIGEVVHVTNKINSTKGYKDSFEYKILNDEWLYILFKLGNSSTFEVEIRSYNTLDIVTGPYPSKRITLDTPYFFDLVLDEEINEYTVNGVTNLEDEVELIIPDYLDNKKISKINDFAFMGITQIKSINFPAGLRIIGNSAFEGCNSLENVDILSNVINIGDSAFKNCYSLKKVIVKREYKNITYIGQNVFDGCSSELEIIVPKNRFAEYKSEENWINYKNIIYPNIDDYETLNLHCLSDGELSLSIDAGYNKLYKLTVECGKNYKFVTNQDTILSIYNSNMTNIYNGDNQINGYLGSGEYYLDVRFSDTGDSGLILLSYNLTWSSNGELIPFNIEYNVLNHLHKMDENEYKNKVYYKNENESGFYRFTISAISENGENIQYIEEILKIYDTNLRLIPMQKLEIDNYLNCAVCDSSSDSIIVYLSENSYYYIDINIPTNNFSLLNIKVSDVDIQELDLFELNPYTNDELINETYLYKDYFRKMVLDMPIQVNFKITYNGILNDDILVLITKMVYDEEENTYVLSNVYCGYINSINVEHNLIFNLDDGMYYIGYFNNNSNEEIDILLERNLTLSGGEYLITDPDLMTECGSHINIYEKYTTTSITTPSYKGTNITEGFTRLIYLTDDNLPSRSRLDYYWYSSNDSVATISSYGTILGLSVSQNTNVKIMAIYKEDPSIAFVKEFIILNDNEGYYIALDIYAEHNISEGSYKIELTSKNSPYPSIQCYEWNVVDTGFENIDAIINIDTYGYVDINQIGTYEIIGEYKYNNRFHIHYHLSVI